MLGPVSVFVQLGSWGKHASLILKPVVCTVVVMAQGEPVGLGYWIGVLVKETGLALKEEVPRDKRALFRKLARFIVENEFEHVSQLVNGRWPAFFLIVISWCTSSETGADPSQWIGADALLNTDLDVLRPLVRRCRSRSPVVARCVMCLHVPRQGAYCVCSGKRKCAPSTSLKRKRQPGVVSTACKLRMRLAEACGPHCLLGERPLES